MIPKRIRLKFFNWLAAGRMTLTTNQSEDYQNMSYTLNAGTLDTITLGGSEPSYKNTITIKITPAQGGTIVNVNTEQYTGGDLYVIPDGADFDRELGKIITMNRLKS